MASELESKLHESMLQCAICLEAYTSPKVLPCIHSFCLNCLQSKYKHDVQQAWCSENTIHCPTCRKKHQMPEGGLQNLPDDYRVNMLTDLMRQHSISKPASSIPESVSTDPESFWDKLFCYICSGNGHKVKPSSLCIECSKVFCPTCLGKHNKHKSYKKHPVIDVTKKSLPSVLCSKHKENFIFRFCCDCEELVCDVCVLQDHDTHAHVKFKYITSSENDELKRLPNHFSLKETSICNQKETIKASHVSNLEKKEKCKREISIYFDDLIANILKQKNKLLSQAEAHFHTVSDEIQEADDQLDDELDKLALMKEQLSCRRNPIQGHSNISVDAPLPEEIVKYVYGGNTTITTNPEEIQYTFCRKLDIKDLDFGHLTTASFNKSKSEKTLGKISSYYRSMDRVVDVCSWHPGEFICAFGDVIMNKKIMVLKGSSRHEVTSGHDRFPGVDHVMRICTGKKSTIAILQCINDYDITIFKEGKHLSSFKCDSECPPRCIALRGDDHVIVGSRAGSGDSVKTTLSCYTYHGIKKWSHDLSCHTKEGYVNLPEYIAIDNQMNILISDFWGNRVHKYGKYGQYKFSIPMGNDVEASPSGVCTDCDDNIFIAYREPLNNVTMFDSCGRFLRILIQTPPEPWGIALCGATNQIAVGTQDDGVWIYEPIKP